MESAKETDQEDLKLKTKPKSHKEKKLLDVSSDNLRMKRCHKNTAVKRLRMCEHCND